MALKLFGGRIVIGKDLSQYSGTTDNVWGFMQQKYGVDYRVRNKLKAYKGVVYGCSSLIGEALGDYEPYVEKRQGDQWEKVDHEFIDLLKRPGGRDLKAQSFSQFNLFEATGIFQVLQGDAFWYMALGKTTRRPREIVILRADKVGTDIDPKTGDINGYFVRQAYGDPIPLEVDEVLRFPLFNPEDPYKGKSVVEAGNDYIATDESTAAFTKNFFSNNAGLSGVLNVKGEVTKGAFRKFVRAWREKHEGVSNAGKIAILRDSDAAFTKVGLGLNELDMSGLRKMSLSEVAMMFKVPLELLGKITEGAGLGRGNIETLEYIFTKWNIDKKMKRFDSILQFALERYYGTDPKQYRICHENIIPEDKEFELNERDKLVDRVYTRDEIRDQEGLDAVPGGNQLFVPAMQVPIGEASSTPPTTDTTTQQGLKIKIIRKIVRTKEISKSERFRLGLMRNQARYERQYRKVLRPIFRDQRAEALHNLEAHGGSLAKEANRKLFDDAAYDSLMVQELTPMLTDLAQTQGGLALIFAGDSENEFHLTSQVLSHINKNTQRMATNFNDDTIAKLNKTLAEGIQAGEALSELKKRVENVYDGIDSYRAERIARTETLKASNDATVWAYRQTGYVTAKAWVVNPDACPQCAEFDGKTVPLDDRFLGLGESYSVTDENGNETTYTNTYDTVEQPPLHPNCRCTVIPIAGEKSLSSAALKKAHEETEILRQKNEKLIEEQARDTVYIKTLEQNLGVNDEPSAEDTRAKEE